MSVKPDLQSSFEDYLSSIESELRHIQEQQIQRDSIYNQCLRKYLIHLNNETKQLKDSQKTVEKRNSNIRQAFQKLYESVKDGTDITLRAIKRTYCCKRQFWKHTIKEFTNSSDIQLKKQLYQLKRQNEDKYLDAIDQGRLINRIPYQRVVSRTENDKTLTNYQINNKILEQKVMEGTNTMTKWKALHKYQNYYEKENRPDQNNANSLRQSKINQNKNPEGFLNRFLKM